MTKTNTNLRKAKLIKNDEFYTQLADIEKEMEYYREYFNGKTVYCNCDDARESNFFNYFIQNFKSLGLKKLITTGYKENGRGVVFVYDGDSNKTEINVSELNGDGDFRSEECVAFLKEADIVVTNPPFSLFREYVVQLMEYKKKFIIIGNLNCCTYREIFPYIKNNEMWMGASTNGTKFHFIAPTDCTNRFTYEKDGKHFVMINNSCWWTNVWHRKRSEPIDLCRQYNDSDYPKYDNYNAIEVSRVENIPMDYDGVMGVPVSFLGKYCPEQFEIIGCFNNYNPQKADIALGQIYGNAVKVPSMKSLFRGPTINGQAKYFRILIRKIT